MGTGRTAAHLTWSRRPESRTRAQLAGARAVAADLDPDARLATGEGWRRCGVERWSAARGGERRRRRGQFGQPDGVAANGGLWDLVVFAKREGFGGEREAPVIRRRPLAPGRGLGL